MLLGPVSDASQATGVGSWTKIDELDYVNGQWANEIMEAQNMTHEFNLPAKLASGDYLVSIGKETYYPWESIKITRNHHHG